MSFAARVKNLPPAARYYPTVDDLLDAVEARNGVEDRELAETLILGATSSVDAAQQLAEEGFNINREKVAAYRKANS